VRVLYKFIIESSLVYVLLEYYHYCLKVQALLANIELNLCKTLASSLNMNYYLRKT